MRMQPGSIICEATIPGNPQPKERPRCSRTGRVYTGEATAAAEAAFGTQVKAGRVLGEPLAEVPLAVELTFHRQTAHRVDLDNLVKLALDACNGIIWQDDAQVLSLTARLVLRSRPPRTELVVRMYGGDA